MCAAKKRSENLVINIMYRLGQIGNKRSLLFATLTRAAFLDLVMNFDRQCYCFYSRYIIIKEHRPLHICPAQYGVAYL